MYRKRWFGKPRPSKKQLETIFLMYKGDETMAKKPLDANDYPIISEPVWITPETSEQVDFNLTPMIWGVYEGGRDIDIQGRAAVVHEVKSEDTLYSFFGTAVLNNQLKRIATGELIKIEYLGNRVSATSGREYKDFSVVRGRRES